MAEWQIVTTEQATTKVEADEYLIEDGIVTFSTPGKAQLLIPAGRLVYAKRLD